MANNDDALIPEVLDDAVALTLGDLCRACDVHAEWLLELVQEGVLEPWGEEPGQWRFAGSSVRYVRIVRRLQHDLGVNLAGAALALEMMSELEYLRERLAVFDHETRTR